MKKRYIESTELNKGYEPCGQMMLREAYTKFCRFCDEYYEAAETQKDKKLAVLLKDEFLSVFDRVYAVNKAFDRPHACTKKQVKKASKILISTVIDFEEEKQRRKDYKTFVGSDKLDTFVSKMKKSEGKKQLNPMLSPFDII